MKKSVKNIVSELKHLNEQQHNNDPYVDEIIETAEIVLNRVDSALCDFHDAFDHPQSELVRENMINNIEEAMYELATLQELCLDEDRIKRLDQQRLLLALKETV